MRSKLSEMLAIAGGKPVREQMLPYGGQTIDDDDIAAVVAVLRSNYLTTGPAVTALETAVARYVGAAECVAVCNGTAALHAITQALGIGPGDEVIVPAMTFAATANAVVYQGGTPVFADVEADTLLIAPADVARKISRRTKAIIAVDYAGQPADYAALREIAEAHGLALVADAAHSLGASDRGEKVGVLADVSSFSLHPVKPITSGEGGLITTNDAEMARNMRIFRNHGITTDYRQREERGSFFYEMVDLGFNYRLSDIHCALALSQLQKLDDFTRRRQEIAARYSAAFAAHPLVRPLSVRPETSSAFHLYMVQLELNRLSVDRNAIFAALRAEGIGVNVHYIPVHLHPFYRTHFGTALGLCPVAESAYHRLLTLPLFPRMTDADADATIDATQKVLTAFSDRASK